MARSASSKRSEARKKPSSTKLRGGTAAAKKASKRGKAVATSRKQSKVKGKPRTASTRSHAGASKPPAKSPRASRTRATRAQSAADKTAAATGEASGESTPGAKRGRREVRNPNVPGYRNTVDEAKYDAMHEALMSALPASPPGITQNEMLERVLPKLAQRHFPGGGKAMWWIKTVQLDQEARGAIRRSDAKPLRWWRG